MAEKKDDNRKMDDINDIDVVAPRTSESPVREKIHRMAEENAEVNVMPGEPIDRTLHETVRSMAGGKHLKEDEFYDKFRKAIVNIYQNEGPDKISEKEIMLLQAISIYDLSRKIESLNLDNIADALGDITLVLDKKLKRKD